jgi:hypothetical protein
VFQQTVAAAERLTYSGWAFWGEGHGPLSHI